MEREWEVAHEIEHAPIRQRGVVRTLEPAFAHFTALKVGAIQAKPAFALGTRVAISQDPFTIAPTASLTTTQVIVMVGKLSLALINLVLVTIASSIPLLYNIFVGGCEGCGAQSLDDWAKVLGEWETIRREIEGILVIRESEGKVEKVKAERGWKVKVVADGGGEISKRLNAFFSLRAYGFVGGKLVWVQKRIGMGIVDVLEKFLKVAKGGGKAEQILDEWSAEMRERGWGNLPGFKAVKEDEKG